jgi:hypothetical protein
MSIAITLHNLKFGCPRCHHERGVEDYRPTPVGAAPMSRQTLALRFRWYLRALDRNPLVRASDRLEALAFLALLVMTLVAIPVAAGLGHQTYDSTMRIVEDETQSRHSVQAVAVEGSTGPLTDQDTPQHVLVQWRDGSVQRTEKVANPRPGTVKAGAAVTIWLDQRGMVVAAPLTPTDAAANATTVGWTAWVLAAVFNGLAALGIRHCLDRSRARTWDRALYQLAHHDDGWANRRN